jgi:solute carrier family 36 (proton-coupled amino acid transporter)
MIIGIVLTIGYMSRHLPPFNDRKFVGSYDTLPLFFGTVLFAYEGIALVLPLQNAMRKPEKFSKPLGVLNVGMVIVTTIYLTIGIIGYWHYGENVLGSVTLNLPTEDMLVSLLLILT